MSDPAPRRKGRTRQPALPRVDLNALGGELDARLPPPEPPGLGEAMLQQARAPRSFVMADSPAEPDPGVRILIALARIEERQNSLVDASKAAQAGAEARHTNIMQAIAAFVPRSEIEKDNRALHDRIDDLEERVKTVEKRIWGAVAAILTTAFGAVASIFGVHVRPG